jgi:aminopeptidase N
MPVVHRNVLRLGRFVVVAITATTLTMLTATSGQAAPGLGDPGLGDPYYPGDGNGGYDVSHYDIRLNYQPSTNILAGSTTILATATQDLGGFNLDFGLPVKSVRVNNTEAKTAEHGTELTVWPSNPVPAGGNMTIVVDYAGDPSTVRDPDGDPEWSRTPDGGLAVQEPHIATSWFPSNDYPTDKATYDISVSVPDGTQVVSNGVLAGTTSTAGRTRWNWRSSKPQATYLTFLAIGKYEIRQQTGLNGQPFITAYSAGLGDSDGAAKASIERTPEALDFLSKIFGPYPFEAQGGVAVSAGVSFSLEDQTRPVFGTHAFAKGANVSVVVHENAHQWFGDDVSVANWSNIFLNEGFATYAQWLWSEQQNEGTAQQLFDYTYAQHPDSDPAWQILPGDPGEQNQFDDFAVYDRGALTLHALRNVIGNAAWVNLVRTWVQRHRYGNGSIQQFIALANQISGKSLDQFFRNWLYTKAKPAPTPDNGFPPATATASTGSGHPVQPKSWNEIRQALAAIQH